VLECDQTMVKKIEGDERTLDACLGDHLQ
jgi:hypothetical protein